MAQNERCGSVEGAFVKGRKTYGRSSTSNERRNSCREEKNKIRERYVTKEEEFLEDSAVANSTNLPIFLMHRPQQFFLSSSSRAEANFLGQVMPAAPSFLTSDSLIPLQMQMYMALIFDNDNGFQF